MEGSGAERLPEGSIAHAISFTSPIDACRSSAVSATFRSAAASDTVWDRFLPPDCLAILSRAVHPVDFSSKRDLFFRLCDSILIDGGSMSFWLDRRSAAKCLMISARALSAVWSDTPSWSWVSLPDSRFSEAAELIDVCWLEIRGKIQTKMLLTQKTTYVAYLVFKLADWSGGLSPRLQEASITVGLQSYTNVVCFHPSNTAVNARGIRSRFVPFWRVLPFREGEEDDYDDDEAAAARPASLSRARDDGWMEVAISVFYNDHEGGEIVMRMMEVKDGDWKKGLIIQGIEIRPKTSRMRTVQ